MAKRFVPVVMAGAVVLGHAAFAAAQDAPPPPPAGGGESSGEAPPVVVEVQPGYAPPPSAEPGPDVNAHLPSSARASGDTSTSSDSFDLGRGAQTESVHGSASGSYVVGGEYVPDLHNAKRGDTLWEISQRYTGNPYNWPRLWSYNKQIQNPHWIYPGDQIRLRAPGVRSVGGFVHPSAIVPGSTVFHRHVGYVLDGDHPVWGQIIGSPEDQMILSEGDEVYVKLDKAHDVEEGQLLTVFEEREVKSLSDHPFVWIRGILRVNRFNPDTLMVRATIIESQDTIERGIHVGPPDRYVDVVKPVRNDKNLEAQIVGALYPHEFYGQHQVVFIDKGEEEGVKVGNRFFAVSRGDEWRLGLSTAGSMADDRAITEDDRFAKVEDTPDTDEPELYPAETYAELIVLRTRPHTATCLVTASIHEIARGAIVVAREGY
jgi:LysM domain-containing protein